MTRSRVIVLLLLVAAVAAYFVFDLGRYLSLDFLKAQQAALSAWAGAHPWLASASYFGGYVLVTALSLPGAAIMSLAGAAVFGLLWATLLVSFASTLGATLAFLIARFLLRESVRRRFGERLAAVDRGIARDGPFYLLTLRVVPAVPFFVINLVMGLTAIRTWTFWWVSQLGMLPGTLVYVNAGTQLAEIDTAGDVFSPQLLLSFALLGLFPLLAKKAVASLRRARAQP